MANRRFVEPLLIAIVVIVAAAAFAQSYQRWLHPIIDSGRDLYVPEQLAGGATLYRDLRYQYPPLAPYLLAAIVRVTGSSLFVYMLIGLAQSLAAASALYVLARRWAGILGAFVAALWFVSIHFTGASTGGSNWMFPYSHAATIGMVFFLWFLVFVTPSGSEGPGRARWSTNAAARPVPSLTLGMTFGVAAAWCKLEYAVAVLLVSLVLQRWKQALVFAASLAAMLAIPDVRGLVDVATARAFFANASGAAQLAPRVGEIFLVVALYAVIVAALRWYERQRVLAAIVVLAASAVIANFAFFRVWSLLHFVILGYAVVKDRRLLPLAAASIAATLRIPINLAPEWYGFVLVLPTYILIVHVLFEYLPERGVYSRKAALLWLPLILVICGRTLLAQRRYFAQKSIPVVTSRGTFHDWSGDRAAVLQQVLPRLTGTLAVMPEGVTINYFSRTRTTLSFTSFIPPETASPQAEERMIGELMKRPPERIAIVTRDVRQFGFRGFGNDYDQRLAGAIRARYAVEARWESPTFTLVLLRRAR